MKNITLLNGQTKPFDFNDEECKHIYRHSSSHILAQAVKRLYPNARLAAGPAVKTGFYYDIEFENPVTPEDLPAIENEMRKIIKEAHPIKRVTKSREEAKEAVLAKGEGLKAILIDQIPEGEEITFYEQGEFSDLCLGPHVADTGQIGAVKLLSLAGAYFLNDEQNAMLTRVYGISFPTQKELDVYLEQLEEAKKRDHRKLGRQLELFAFYDEGPGFAFFLPKGIIIKNALLAFWREKHIEAGYEEISTPILLDKAMWEQSGHWEHYKENMYLTDIAGAPFAVKPMNCPGGMLVYKFKPRSYKDLPLRMAELGLVHRHEKSGVLHGLMRVRAFTQDDAHIFMTPEMIKDEIKGVIKLINEFYGVFGFTYSVELSTRPKKSMGTDEAWAAATNALKAALDEESVAYAVNEGDGAFYGPKIDFHLNDSIGRTWQCGTIQLDFQMPECFNLEYTDAGDQKKRPVMIHRVILGSIERFIGILTEHYAGAFPLWLAPVQAVICPISDKFALYADDCLKKIQAGGIRAEIDARTEKIGYKIREALSNKIPYILVVGEKEAESGTVSVRSRQAKDSVCAISAFIVDAQNNIKNKC